MRQDLDRDLMLLLHDVARLIRVEADKRSRVYGMTRARWVLLLWLERSPGLSQKEAADMLEVEPISVARLVDRLEASGLVERRPDPDDRRVWRLYLRPAAADVLLKIGEQRDELRNFVVSGISAEARSATVEALLQMKSNLLGSAPASTLKETG